LKSNVSYHKNNFYRKTFCVFEEVFPEVIINKKANYISRTGSAYYFSSSGVIRVSSHWGRVGDCRWLITSIEHYKNQSIKIGYATWDRFFLNSENLDLYYVKYDAEKTMISIGHKDDAFYDQKAVLRNAKETLLAIQFIKDINKNQGWIKHINSSSSNTILEIIADIIYHYKDTIAVKRKYLSQARL